jgi:hypothetical protein
MVIAKYPWGIMRGGSGVQQAVDKVFSEVGLCSFVIPVKAVVFTRGSDIRIMRGIRKTSRSRIKSGMTKRGLFQQFIEGSRQGTGGWFF